MPSPIEISAVKLECFHRETDVSGTEVLLGTATGSFFVRNKKSYLVTNWHVLTGRRPNAPNKSETGAVITHLRVLYHDLEKDSQDRTVISRLRHKSFEIEINSVDGENPKWIEDPSRPLGNDIAAIECNIPENAAIKPANLVFEDKHVEPVFGDNVLILGFPRGLSGGTEALPIGKVGHIASGPMISHRGHPRFLIDARTYKGMSGAPVFLNDFRVTKSQIGTHQMLLGVYSGRLTSKIDNTETEIGYCWRTDYIEQLLFDRAPWPANRTSRLSSFANSPTFVDSADVKDNQGQK
ncbi:MAG: serine protease [Pseudomonadota bacterium]